MASRQRDYQPGDRVPGTVYLVVRLIGAGGMGTVYDVEDTTIGKRYVLKTLHPQLGAREDLARRMQNEARTLAKLHHPNIVEVITAGVTADELHLPYYVMERFNGQSLRLVLEKKGQLELPHVYHIGIDLLDALEHAHDKGVIHRDVKPDNIFLHRTSAGITVTKLLDFGILSMLDSENRETAGRFLGTLRYAAPEQLRGERPTPKMDIYAAGLVLYEMIAGRGPFDDEGDQHRVASAHIHKPPVPPSNFAIIPRELDALIMAALSKSPEARPRDAFSFAASLRNFKKALAGAHRRESTDNRATAVAVLEPDGAPAPFVEVRQSSSDGYIVSPAPADTPPMSAPAPAPPPTSLPKTTLPGMSPPTVGPSLVNPPAPAPAVTATTPSPVDRLAPTNSIAVDTPRSPQHGTESIPLTPAALVGPGPTLPMSPSPAATPFQWPVERPVARSEEPQVRSLDASASTGSGSALLIVGAVASVVLLALFALILLVARHQAASRTAAASASPPPTSSILAAPPSAQPVVTLAAPTIAPPALDDMPSATAAPSSHAATAPPASSSGKPAVAPAKPIAPGRPGPGF